MSLFSNDILVANTATLPSFQQQANAVQFGFGLTAATEI